jgi:hypothetical protein
VILNKKVDHSFRATERVPAKENEIHGDGKSFEMAILNGGDF